MKFLLSIAFVLYSVVAFAHDTKHVELNDWYTGLKRADGFSCCNVQDCHPTDAEMRGEDWWARLGMPNGDGTWELKMYVMIPKDKVIMKKDNPTGYPVICHAWSLIGHELNVPGSTIYCFIPSFMS